jgi:7,8-dihydropterin-6-yl-methyl-4-(beta-D-ribofuranosyl)aminobenzene 5'-phosphate synthase
MRALALCFAALLAAPAAAADIELINVYDAFGKPPKGAQLDFGFAAVAKHGGKTYLFDGGANASVLRKNMAAMGISPGDIDVVVASHNHHDHVGGLDYIVERNPDVELYLPKDFALGAEVALPLTKGDRKLAKEMDPSECYLGDCALEAVPVRSSGRFRKAKNLKWIAENTEIGEGVKIVHTKSKLMGTFSGYPPKSKAAPAKAGMPELSLVFSTSDGAVILVGCSHAGVENIVKAANKEIEGDIALVAGGFHLAPYKKTAIKTTAGILKRRYKVKRVAPAHCTGYTGFAVLKKTFGENYLPFGLGWRIGG